MGGCRAWAQLAVSRREQPREVCGEPNANFSHFPVLPGASPGPDDSIAIKQFSGRVA